MARYFEDLSVGVTHEAGTFTLDREEMVGFAEQFDPQPFHVDEEAAASSVFDGLVASGLHTLCLSVRLFVTDVLAEKDIANIGGRGMGDLRWPAPVRPDQPVAVSATVQEKTASTSRSDRGYVDFELRARREEDDQTVLSVVLHNIVGTRPD